MKEFITCGVLKEGIDFAPIVCDPATGEMILADDINGNCVLTNLGFHDPMMVGEDAAVKMAVDYKVDGVILTQTYIIFLKDNVATLRTYTEPDKVKMSIDFDTNIEYEGTVE